MTFQYRLKEARKHAGMTQRALADKLGLKHNAVSNWEHGHSKPDLAMLSLVCSILNVSVNYILNEPVINSGVSAKFTERELNLVRQYQMINDTEKAAIDAMLLHFVSQVKQSVTPPPPLLNVVTGRISLQSAAAGFGVYLDEDSFEEISIVNNYLTKRASFYVPVSGDSMEPKFHDGDILIVENAPVKQGEIGVVTLDGSGYVKQLGERTLISLNPEYNPIAINDDIICNGKVIGVLEPDWIIE